MEGRSSTNTLIECYLPSISYEPQLMEVSPTYNMQEKQFTDPEMSYCLFL